MSAHKQKPPTIEAKDSETIHLDVMNEAADLYVRLEYELKLFYWFEPLFIAFIEKLKGQSIVAELERILHAEILHADQNMLSIEELLVSLGSKVEGRECPTLGSLLNEAELILISQPYDCILRDMSILSILQKITHQRMAAFWSMKMLAMWLDYRDELEILEVLLDRVKCEVLVLSAVAQSIR